MKDSDIAFSIKKKLSSSFYQDDANNHLLTDLLFAIKRFDKKERKQVSSFLIKEIKYNIYGLDEMALELALHGPYEEIRKKLPGIYRFYKLFKGNDWRIMMIEATLLINAESEQFFVNEINGLMKKDASGFVYYTMVKLCNSYPQSGLKMIAEYYYYAFQKDQQLQNFLEHRLDYFISCCKNSLDGYIAEILRHLCSLNEEAFSRLREAFIQALESYRRNSPEKLKHEINREIEIIKSL